MAEGNEGAVYLTVEHVLDIHAAIFECTQRQAEDQLRNRGGLEGSLARPMTYAMYQGADLSMQAAVLAEGIAEGQHFIDGNKRTALISLRVFLQLNGHDLAVGQEDLAQWILDLADELDALGLAERIRGALHTA